MPPAAPFQKFCSCPLRRRKTAQPGGREAFSFSPQICCSAIGLLVTTPPGPHRFLLRGHPPSRVDQGPRLEARRFLQRLHVGWEDAEIRRLCGSAPTTEVLTPRDGCRGLSSPRAARAPSRPSALLPAPLTWRLPVAKVRKGAAPAPTSAVTASSAALTPTHSLGGTLLPPQRPNSPSTTSVKRKRKLWYRVECHYEIMSSKPMEF